MSGGYIIHCVVCNYTPYTDVRYTFKHILDKRNTWFIIKRMMTGQKSNGVGRGGGRSAPGSGKIEVIPKIQKGKTCFEREKNFMKGLQKSRR